MNVPSWINVGDINGKNKGCRYITGLGTVVERMLILVDIEKLMTSNEMTLTD